METQIPASLNFSHEQNYHRLQCYEVKKVLVIQGSPRKSGVSKTEILTNAFVKGCKQAGAETETICLRDKTIKQCQGCFTCWTKTPGKCIFKDDVEAIMTKANAADLVIYASPLYHFGIIALMKKYIERTLLEVMPFLVARDDGKTTHPHREGFKRFQNVVIIGVCGFPEVSHFGAFSASFHYIANAGGKQGLNIIAEIYRPLSEILNNPFYKEENDRVLSAAETAGKDLVTKGHINAATIDAIAEIRLAKAEIYESANSAWETCIKEGVTMPQFQKKLLESS
jgi:multimeric flavodoxin WrbA